MKKIYYTVSMLLLSKVAFSQEKIGTNPTVINSNAVLELEATNKGLLLPRVTLTGTNSPAPLSSNIAGMTIYNTATAGISPNNVTPGVYFNDGTKWIRVGDESLTGKTILNGTSNPTTVGNIGDFYINTSANTIFGPKTAGGWGTGTSLVGPQGVAGPQGTAGTNGNTVLNGTSNPIATNGANGDFYLNTTTKTLFGPKAAGVWPATGTSLVGTAGTNGTNGTNGNTVLNGSSNPLAATGANGDFYINTTTNVLIGPKAGGVWPAVGISLVGPQGVAGATGPAGPTGPQGPAGNIASLTNGRVLIGNASNVPTEQTMSGDVTITNTGVATISSNAVGSSEITDASIVAADIANDAVTMTKIDQAGATSGQVLTWNGTDWAPQTNLGSSGSIYNSDGTISSTTRNVNIGGNELKFNTTGNGKIKFGQLYPGYDWTTYEGKFSFASHNPDRFTLLSRNLEIIDFGGTINSFEYAYPRASVMGFSTTIGVPHGGSVPIIAFGTSGLIYGLDEDRRLGGTSGAINNEALTAYSWGALGYRNSAGTEYGSYGSSAASTGTGILPNSTIDGIGGGFFGGIAGSVSKGLVIGEVNSGELFASYNSGNTYTLGKNVEIVETNNEQKTAVYSNTSIESTIYSKGKGNLNSGSVYIPFDRNFTGLLGEVPVVTITPNGACNGVYIESIDKNGFTIREQGNGTSNVSISWIAVGNRIDNKLDVATPLVTKSDFETNMQDVLFDDSNSGQGQEMWWNGTEIQFGQQPIKQTKKGSTNK